VKRVVQVVELLALLGAIVFVVALFANEPEDVETDAVDEPTEEVAPEDVDGAAIFSERCASCHGADGEGRNGPQLSDGRAVERFPDVQAQIDVVTDGRGGMPSFESRLSEAEIQAVVEYTRAL
jgi:mono/diheme cytochrome c family protein